MHAQRDVANPRLVYLVPERGLERAARGFLLERTDRCAKCGSGFITHEPAFVHCHYCGSLYRVAAASLEAQELFEIRSGLRLAS
jgi:hypothetical protein